MPPIQAGKIDGAGKQDNKSNDSKDISGGTGETKTNFKGEKACFHCGGDDHRKYECPKLSADERKELI